MKLNELSPAVDRAPFIDFSLRIVFEYAKEKVPSLKVNQLPQISQIFLFGVRVERYDAWEIDWIDARKERPKLWRVTKYNKEELEKILEVGKESKQILEELFGNINSRANILVEGALHKRANISLLIENYSKSTGVFYGSSILTKINNYFIHSNPDAHLNGGLVAVPTEKSDTCLVCFSLSFLDTNEPLKFLSFLSLDAFRKSRNIGEMEAEAILEGSNTWLDREMRDRGCFVYRVAPDTLEITEGALSGFVLFPKEQLRRFLEVSTKPVIDYRSFLDSLPDSEEITDI